MFGHVYCLHLWNFCICWLQDILLRPFKLLCVLGICPGHLAAIQSGKLQHLFFRLNRHYAHFHSVGITIFFFLLL